MNISHTSMNDFVPGTCKVEFSIIKQDAPVRVHLAALFRRTRYDSTYITAGQEVFETSIFEDGENVPYIRILVISAGG